LIKKKRINDINYKFISRSSFSNTFIVSSDLIKESDRQFRILYDMLELGLEYMYSEHNLSKNIKDVLVTCQCKCGKIFSKKYINIVRSYTCNCSMYQYKKGEDSYLFSGVGEISGKYWASILARRRTRNLQVNITKEIAYDIFLKQNKLCAYSGKLLDSKTMSLDRIDSNDGYVVGNVQWVHKDVNSMKWDLTHRQFLHWCKLISNPVKSNTKYVTLFERNSHTLKYVGNLSKTYYSSVKQKAQIRNIKFELIMDEMWDLYVKQGGKCAITGIRLNLKSKGQSASLDRIDSSKGYFIENVQWIHKIINTKIKINFNQEYMIKTCKEIYEYQKNK
jgi:hypothetical protein